MVIKIDIYLKCDAVLPKLYNNCKASEWWTNKTCLKLWDIWISKMYWLRSSPLENWLILAYPHMLGATSSKECCLESHSGTKANQS